MNKLILAVVTLAAAAPAWGQVQQVVGGTALDANPMVGSGGSNRPVRGYVPVNGNDIITGNVSGLKYFHGRVPYSNPYEFGAPLGSSRLSAFARQSSGAPLTGTYTGQATPYFLPSATVTGAGGAIGPRPVGSGFDNRLAPGSSASPLAAGSEPVNALASPMVVGQGMPYRRYDRVGAEEEDTISPLQPSGLYGFRSPMQLRPIKAMKDISAADVEKAERLDQEAREREERERTDLGKGQQVGDTRGQVRPMEGSIGAPPVTFPLDARVGRIRGMSDGDVYTSLAGSLRGRAAATQGGVAGGLGTGTGPAVTPGSVAGGPSTQSATGAPALPEAFNSTRIDPKTGQPVLRPEVEKPSEWQSTDPTKPFYRPARARTILEEPKETLQSGREVKPIESFQGKTPSLFNQFMEVAEKQLKEGRYLDAAETYQEATRFAGDNPLPTIGRAHAQLAAGMYANASSDLKSLMERRPELAAVRYDLVKFLPEKRLAFLQQDLSTLAYGGKPNTTANFLLAYLSYQLGDKERVAKELEYWKGRSRRDPWPAVLEKAWVEEKK